MALVRRAEGQIADGQPAEAAHWLEQALGQYPMAWRAGVDGETQYYRNRRELDHPLLHARICRTLATAYEQQGRADHALSVREGLFSVYPDIPGTRALCVDLARAYCGRENWEASLTFGLRAFDFTGDRCSPWRTRLPENQPYLDAISRPNDEATVAECLGLIGEACAALTTGRALADAELAQLAGLWAQAEAAGYDVRVGERWAGTGSSEVTSAVARPLAAPGGAPASTGGPQTDWERVLTACRDTVLEPLGHLALAEWLHYRGFYGQARPHYHAALEMHERLPGSRAWVEYGLGELGVHTGDLHEAVARFGNCSPAPDAALAAQAALRLAECLECLGESQEATAANERIAAHEGWPYFVRERAAYALQRLGEYSERLPPPAADSQTGPAAYLGQDRQTQGDWRCYGRDFFALCASGGVADISGGALAPLAYAGRTRNPALKIYWWRGASDPDPSMLYDPIKNGRRPHNWDDRGERTPLCEGPDLVVQMPVPEGTFRLALYFVNDHNYYEPSRQYMVYVTDAATEAVLAAAPVRDFVSGVYVHFRVSGARDLAIRIWRNTGLNTLLSGIFLDDLSAMPRWSEIRQHALADEVIRTAPPQLHRRATALGAVPADVGRWRRLCRPAARSAGHRDRAQRRTRTILGRACRRFCGQLRSAPGLRGPIVCPVR
ncbi:MAG: tetratricopeptide repeat protein [Armatimonadota bacterium]